MMKDKHILEQTQRRKSGKSDTYELEIKLENGQKRQILVTANPQYQNKKFEGTFAVFRDNTDRKITENHLRNSERELIESNAAKDKFLSIIAHDLKGPFSSILGCSDLLLMDYSNYDKDEVLTLVKMINDASRQANNLLENLLDWSRVQTGRLTGIPEAVEIQKTVESAFQLYEANAREKNLVLTNKIKPGTLVFGEKNMIDTIFRNLISNAIKFTQPRGKVTVVSKKLRKYNEIQVIDSGIGIPDELLDKLFRMGEKVSRSGTANEEGTGLGLILCKEFAEKNNGSIKVSSKQGKGSTFSVMLPRQLNQE